MAQIQLWSTVYEPQHAQGTVTFTTTNGTQFPAPGVSVIFPYRPASTATQGQIEAELKTQAKAILQEALGLL